MAKTKILDHPVVHEEVSNEDRLIFLVVGILITVGVFIVMKTFNF